MTRSIRQTAYTLFAALAIAPLSLLAGAAAPVSGAPTVGADYRIGPGSIFLLPAGIPHSPQRGPGTVGLVIERRRAPGEHDALRWYCESCQHLLYEESFELKSIDTQLAPLMARFYADRARRTCSRCGAVLAPPVEAG